jgi:hypothetical protein
VSDLRYLVSCSDWAGRERTATVRHIDGQVALMLPAGGSASFTSRQLSQLRRVLTVVTSPETTARPLAQLPGGAGTAGLATCEPFPAVSGGPLDVPL